MKAPIEQIRYENPKLSEQIFLEEGDQVEVFWRPAVDKEYLWYLAKIRAINWNEYFVCEFLYDNKDNVDIFEKKYIRLANPNPTFRVKNFVHSK